MTNQRIIDITLDESTIVRWNADIEHERRVAVYDLVTENSFTPARIKDPTGPYKLHLSIVDGRLLFDIKDENDTALDCFRLPTTPFRRVIREYFAICESYYAAIRTASPSQIEAIDMGRRGLHNEGSETLQDMLEDKAIVDFDTARRLFTLICVLHLKGV